MDPDRANGVLLGVAYDDTRRLPDEFVGADAGPDSRQATIDEPVDLQSPANRRVEVA